MPSRTGNWFEQIAQTVDGCPGLENAAVPEGTHYFYGRSSLPANLYVAADDHHDWPSGPVGAGGLSPGVFSATDLAWCAKALVGTPPPVDDCAGAHNLRVSSRPIARRQAISRARRAWWSRPRRRRRSDGLGG